MPPGTLPDPIAVAASVAECLERIGVPYVIGGSFASSLYGEPRSTNDVDVVTDLQRPTALAFVDALGDGFYVDAGAAIDAVDSGQSFNIVHIGSAVKVDIFIAGSDLLDRERLRVRRRVEIQATDAPVGLFIDTPEHTVLRKLEWYRRGGESSERQWRDVLGVLRVQRNQLDESYMRTWATRLGIADLLEKALMS